jgi:hypothetical protein
MLGGTLFLVAVTLSLGENPLSQDRSQVSDPETVARAWFDASRNQDWDRASSIVDLNALITFRNDMIPMLLSAKKGKQRDDVFTMFQVKSLAELSQLDPRSFFARLMRFSMGQHPGMAEEMEQSSVLFVGSVAESQDVVHLVYRMRTQHKSLTSLSVQVISLQRTGGKWYVLLTGEMKGLR